MGNNRKKCMSMVFAVLAVSPVLCEAAVPGVEDLNKGETVVAASVSGGEKQIENGFSYAHIPVYTDDRYKSIKDEDDRKDAAKKDVKKAFRAFLEDPKNAGISVDLLKNFSKDQLEFFYAKVKQSQAISNVIKSVITDESVEKKRKELIDEKSEGWRKKLKQVSKTASDIDQLDDGKTKEQMKTLLEGYKKELKDDYVGLLKGLKLKLSDFYSEREGNWFTNLFSSRPEKISALMSGVIDYLNLMEEISKEKFVFQKNEQARSLPGELVKRLSYIARFAEACGENKEEQATFQAVLMASWRFTLEDRVLEYKLDGKTEKIVVPGTYTQAVSGLSSSQGSDIASVKPVKPTEGSKQYTVLQAGVYNYFVEQLSSSFSVAEVPDKKFQTIGAFAGLRKFAQKPESATFLKDINEIFSKRVAEIEKEKETLASPQAQALRETLKKFKEGLANINKMEKAKAAYLNGKKGDKAGEGLAPVRIGILEFLKKYAPGFSVENLQKEDKIKELMDGLARKATEANQGDLKTDIKLFAQDLQEYSRSQYLSMFFSAQAYAEYKKIEKEYEKLKNEIPSGVISLVKWIQDFDAKRKNIQTNMKAKSYGEVAKDMYSYFASVKRFHSFFQVFSLPFTDGATNTVHLIKGDSAKMQLTTTSDFSSLVAPMTDKFPSLAEKRQICLAGYELYMRAHKKEFFFFRQEPSGAEGAIAVRPEDVATFMQNKQVLDANYVDLSLYEGLKELVEMINDLQNAVLLLLQKEFGSDVIIQQPTGKEDMKPDASIKLGEFTFRMPESVTFDTGKFVLKENGKKALVKYYAALGRVLPKYDKLFSKRLAVEGHSDERPYKNDPSGKRNVQLSKNRAQALSNFWKEQKGDGELKKLQDKGFFLAIEGFGPSKPVMGKPKDPKGVEYDNWLAKCRRAEVKFNLDMDFIIKKLARDPQFLRQIKDAISAGRAISSLEGEKPADVKGGETVGIPGKDDDSGGTTQGAKTVKEGKDAQPELTAEAQKGQVVLPPAKKEGGTGENPASARASWQGQYLSLVEEWYTKLDKEDRWSVKEGKHSLYTIKDPMIGGPSVVISEEMANGLLKIKENFLQQDLRYGSSFHDRFWAIAKKYFTDSRKSAEVGIDEKNFSPFKADVSAIRDLLKGVETRSKSDSDWVDGEVAKNMLRMMKESVDKSGWNLGKNELYEVVTDTFGGEKRVLLSETAIKNIVMIRSKLRAYDAVAKSDFAKKFSEIFSKYFDENLEAVKVELTYTTKRVGNQNSDPIYDASLIKKDVEEGMKLLSSIDAKVFSAGLSKWKAETSDILGTWLSKADLVSWPKTGVSGFYKLDVAYLELEKPSQLLLEDSWLVLGALDIQNNTNTRDQFSSLFGKFVNEKTMTPKRWQVRNPRTGAVTSPSTLKPEFEKLKSEIDKI